MRKLLAPFAFILAMGVGTSSGPALAQLPEPRLSSVFPPGGRQGESVEIQLVGNDLEGVDALWFDHPGLVGTRVKDATFKVSIAPGTPIGQHDLRAVGPLGISNPRTFVVGDRPEGRETEPNNRAGQANPLSLNMVVNGRIDPATDVDCFALEGKKGQRFVLGLNAARIDSRLDATLRVFDASGRQLAESNDAQGFDPFLDLTLPADGSYTIKVHDVIYAGSPDHVYRLTLHDGPHLDAIRPVVATPGTSTEFQLLGRNLGGLREPGLQVEGIALERKTVSIALPASADPDPSAPGSAPLPSPIGSRRGIEHRERGANGSSNPIFIALADDPVILEQESNMTDQAQDVSLPCDISGSFGVVGDVDLYRFRGKKGEVWWVEAFAERIGSPADPTFLIQKVVEKGPPQDLATGDDLAEPVGEGLFDLNSVDPAVRWQVPEDGLYQVAINDLYNSRRGDPRLSYRLNIRPERPDFQLFVVPSGPSQPGALTIGAGGRGSALVLARRRDGFAGAIRVEARGLPPGVSCDPIVIGPGQSRATIVFQARDDASPTVGVATLFGIARTNEEIVHPALAGTPIRPSSGQPKTPPARLTRGFVLAVNAPAAFNLTARPTDWVVGQGHQLNVEVALIRRGGFAEPVQVTGSDLPPNLGNASITIPKEANSGVVPFYLPRNVPPGEYSFLLQGSGPVPFSKDPNAKEKPKVNVTAPSNPIHLTVLPAPVNLALNNKGGALRQGESLEVDVTVNRQNGFDGEVRLALVAPPVTKLTADPVTVPKGQTVARLVVRADAASPEGAVAAAVVRAVATSDGRPIEVDEPLAITINKK